MTKSKVILFAIILLISVAVEVSAATSTVSITDIEASENESVNVTINIDGVTDVAGSHILLGYDPTVVHVTDIGNSSLSFETYKDINNTSGYTRYAVVNLPDPLSGPSVQFAEVTLEAVGSSGDSCTLDLTVVSMQDGNYDEISRTVEDGTFTISDSESPTVANPLANESTVPIDNDNDPRWGETTQLKVTVTDQNEIDTVTIDLSSIGGSSSESMSKIGVTDVWAITTNVSLGTTTGTHNLQVNATDANGNSNNDVSIELIVVDNGDVNEDGTCNLGDGIYLSNNILEVPGFEEMIEGASDVDGDANINIDDGIYLINHKLNIQEYSTLH
ncbi:MAG: cohesin domain-containing protein [Halobacteriota archaeon]|nr:cohesin domain-containing protein [Halobacteriota archaeon]